MTRQAKAVTNMLRCPNCGNEVRESDSLFTTFDAEGIPEWFDNSSDYTCISCETCHSLLECALGVEREEVGTMTKTKTITDYRIVDHGIEHAQYFQGHGTAFTNWDHCVTGCGDNFAEAIEDALESMAQGEECDGVDFAQFERLMKSEHPEYCRASYRLDDGAWVDKPSVQDNMSETEVEQSDCELYYHVSIDYNVGGASK